MSKDQESHSVSGKGERSRKSIVDSATKLIAEHGFSALTLQDILSHARDTKGKFFHHFSTKEELFKAVLLEALGSRKIFDFRAYVNEIVEASAYYKLQMLLDRIIEWHSKGLPAEMRLCVMATLFFPGNGPEMKRIREHLRRNLEVLVDLIAEAQSEGELPSYIKPENLAFLMPSMAIGGNVIEFLSDGESLPAKNLVMLKQLLECAHRTVEH